MEKKTNTIPNQTVLASNGAAGVAVNGSNGISNSSDGILINRPKVLMYHRVVDDRELSKKQETCVYIDEFHKQLELLDRLGYSTITLRDYWLFKQDKLQLPKKPIILTFDDGYLDTYKFAFPLLKEYGMKAVVFVLGDRSVKSNVWDTNGQNLAYAPLMDSHQIKELHDNGFEIGAHSLRHSNLTQLSEEACTQTIKKPKIVVEALIGSRVISFAYPYGLLNQHIKKKVNEAGYKFACSVFSGPARFGDDPLEIRRLAIHNTTSILGFAARVIAPYEYAEWMWWKSRHINGHLSDPIKSTINAN